MPRVIVGVFREQARSYRFLSSGQLFFMRGFHRFHLGAQFFENGFAQKI